jgi:hypothetical protein
MPTLQSVYEEYLILSLNGESVAINLPPIFHPEYLKYLSIEMQKNNKDLKPPLVYVWLGSDLPAWARVALKLSNLNCGLVTILLSSKAIGSVLEVNQQIFLEDFYTPPKNINHQFEGQRLVFRDGFWLKTTERFFVLQQYMEKYSKKSIFHAELDNLIFDISNLNKKLDSIGNGFFCPRDSMDRGIASLVYINQVISLKEMTDAFIKNMDMYQNDMLLLGSMLKKSNNFYSLPTENRFEINKTKSWATIDPNDLGGIFDAAAIGQFLFGIDPRNCNTLLFNGFENENKGCNLYSLQFAESFENGTFQVTDNVLHKSLNLYNIHVHSKLFNLLSNPRRLSHVLANINSGKKTLMTLNWKHWRGLQRIVKLISSQT